MSIKREEQERLARLALTTIPVKSRLAAIVLFCCTSVAIYFIFTHCGSALMSILNKNVHIYYDWRAVPLFLWLPAFFYADMVIFSIMLFPLTRNLQEFLLKGMNSFALYGWLILILSLPISLFIYIYLCSSYHSCGFNGPLSGMHFEQDKEMCRQFKH